MPEREEIKVGDRVKSNSDAPILLREPREVLAVGDDWVLIDPWQKGELPRTVKRADLVKVPAFFEAWKTYECAGDRFEAIRVDENSDGSLVAYGKLVSGSGGHVWVVKVRQQFAVWREVTE